MTQTNAYYPKALNNSAIWSRLSVVVVRDVDVDVIKESWHADNGITQINVNKARD
jgi:hypothetical protein